DQIPEKLLFHFGMTGDLHYVKQGREEASLDRFTRLVLRFDNGYELRWMNMRKLGKVYLVKDPNLIPLLKDLGPEPLTFSERSFVGLLKHQGEKGIKAFSLDQRGIAGIGNVYGDEILFGSRIASRCKMKTLFLEDRVRLYESVAEVVREAIRRRSPTGMLYGAFWLLPERVGMMRGPRDCRHRLRREAVAGRTAVYCPVYQRMN
ncbi:MAG: DNA-formamidopyrimidine glycosylase family protein, partial [Candidatus Binatia bacterium]|nr:DNA-formamidopyrimidine glycosylase family protein [Candidatus Binatia bacterium]